MENLLGITQAKINLFKSLFRGRIDIYAKLWKNPINSKSGYAPVFTLNSGFALNDSVIKQHLIGKETIGIYPLLHNNTVYFLAIDFDRENWLKESLSLIEAANKYSLPCYLERSKSGNGSHVWLFFETEIPAWKARQLGKYLLSKVLSTSHKAFDRLFPSQDEHSGKGYGNLIALPLQGEYLNHGNSSFIDLNGSAYEDQWAYLNSLVKISASDIDKILNSVEIIQPKPRTRTDTPVGEINDDEEDTFIKTTPSPHAKLILSSQIYVPSAFLPDKLYKFLKSRLNFPNPQFYELQRRGYSTWNTHKFLKNIEVIDSGILVPAGILDEIQNFAAENNLKLEIDDQQVTIKPSSFKTTLELNPEQLRVARELLRLNRVILEAKPGFGKTLVALYCVSRRKQSTLIVVHTRSLLHQWQKQLQTWFSLEKGELGMIGENKWKLGKKVTVASYYTLAKRGLDDIKDKFGFVVVDECHHVPANTFTQVLKSLPAKYVLGLTATAYSKDKLERLMNFYIGPVIQSKIKTRTIVEENTENKVTTHLITRKTNFTPKEKGSDFNEISLELVEDDECNQLVIDDVVEAVQSGSKCLVLTERVDHCKTLLELMRKNLKGIHAATFTGRATKKSRENLFKRIRQDRFQVLIATGKVVGEGFDWPELTHLFLVFPFSWKGKLIQYIGRVQRQAEDKQAAYVYDYVDFEVQMLRIMYFKRLRAYRSLNLVKEKTISAVKNKVSENQLALI